MADGSICPLPEPLTPQKAHATYLKQKANMPTLTPAAWRKAAAQELGMDYNSFLKIWKQNKGASKATSLIADPVPVAPLGLQPGPTMNLLAKSAAKKVTAENVTYDDIFVGMSNAADNQEVRKHLLFNQANAPKIFVDPKTMYAGQDVEINHKLIQDLMDGTATSSKGEVIAIRIDGKTYLVDGHHRAIAAALKGEAVEVRVVTGPKMPTLAVKDFPVKPKDIAIPTATEEPASMTVSQATKKFQESLDGIVKAVDEGSLDLSDVNDIINDLKVEYKGKLFSSEVEQKILQLKTTLKKDAVKKAFNKPLTTEAEEMSSKFSEDLSGAMNAVQTTQGELTHDLARVAYKKMQADMPGATAAQWRHAAAEYLGIDYNDYLAAWKKAPGAATKVKSMPVNATTPTSVAPQGKYANVEITADELKAELAAAYGPSANKAYINLQYDSINGTYTVKFPQSLLPTQVAKDAVAEALGTLGLEVNQGFDLGEYIIKSGVVKKKPLASAVQKAAKAPTTGTETITLADGTVAWDQASANIWSKEWWSHLTTTQRDAVKRYTANGYRQMNADLRGGRAASPTSRALSDAMVEVEHEFTTFRGTDISMSQFHPGSLWKDNGFMSTSVNRNNKFGGSVKFEIRVTKGVRGAYVDPFSSHVGEREFILDRGTDFRILSVDPNTNTVVMVAMPRG